MMSTDVKILKERSGEITTEAIMLDKSIDTEMNINDERNLAVKISSLDRGRERISIISLVSNPLTKDSGGITEQKSETTSKKARESAADSKVLLDAKVDISQLSS